MKENNHSYQLPKLLLGLVVLYTLATLGLLVLFFGGQNLSAPFTSVYGFLSLLVLVMVALDMKKQRIYNLNFWLFSLLIFVYLTPVLYLFQRPTLIRLGKRFNRA